ncbi:MAG: ethylbenzene dehydrogenase-related protein, partial [Bacteroidota bacterium]
PTDEDLRRTITMGMPGSAMPSWDRLSGDEISNLITYIKTLSDRFRTETPSGAVTIETEPQATPEMFQDGKSVYALMGCWTCHGKTGAGDGPSSADLMDDFGRPIRPYNFTRAGAFKGGGTPRDIYRTFSTGIGGTPMPGYGEDALTMARESFAEPGNLEGQYSPNEILEVKNFVAKLPSEAELNKMTPAERKSLADTRRWSLVYYVLSLNKSGKTQVSYTTKDHVLVSDSVDDAQKFTDPASDRWKSVRSLELPLISLWQRDTPTDRVVVKSVMDRKAIVFLMEWEDPTKDDGALYNAKFGDAAAVQFPLDPASEPFFAMGDTNLVTDIWHWKSWWERDLQHYVGVNSAFPNNATDFYPFDVSGGSSAEYFASKDSARTLSMPWNAGWGSGNLLSAQVRKSSVEDLNAKGFGTLTSQGQSGQNVRGKGVWQKGKWSVIFIRTLDSQEKNDVVLKLGSTVPAAFGVWDGSLGDRNGQKMVTNWYRLTIGGK